MPSADETAFDAPGEPDRRADAHPAGHGPHGHDHHHTGGTRRPLGPITLLLPLLAAVVLRDRIGWFEEPDVRLWATLFVSICVQALPFLVLGVVLSGLIAAWVSPEFVGRVVPKRPLFAVPAAGAAGIALPGCECGSVPIAGRLVRAGTPPAAALTFLLAAPAINPVVLVSTAVAFPNDRIIVVARFLASFLTAVAVGAWWARRGRESLLDGLTRDVHDHGGHWQRFTDAASRDLLHAGGYLVVGAMAAATLQLVVPRSALDAVTGNEILAVSTMATLAVVLSICSEADAFVAAGLPQFSLTSRLVFLVVGPCIDLKLIAMQSGVFGRRFALVFAPMTLAIAVLSAVLVGQVLL